MKRISLLSLGLAFGVVAALPANAADKVTWTFSLYGPPRAATVTFEHLAKVAKEKSGGNFIINLRYNEQLGEAKDMLDGIKVDAYQGAFVAYSYAPAKTPLQGVLDMPFLPIPDLVASAKVQDAYQAWKPVSDELSKWNAMHFMTLLLPQYEFMGTGKPPRDLEDWKGMRVRALGGLGDAMKLLGAVPTSVSAPEVYTALERGTFQAASFPFTYSFTAYKLHEVSKWYTLGMQLGIIHNSVVLSQTAWKALPDEYKKILQDAKEETYRLQREAYDAADKKAFPLFEKRKLEVVKVTQEMRDKLMTTAAQPVWDHWVAETEKKGLPGKEALEMVLSLAKKNATN
ncbi:TRAP transporter substrate-binding protein DctP [Reyranella sp.]|uniref:TRAP transporter substrate-binding protein DctP n=1 Tax=Reyranella sp. TaxID=1929291 RepID=UPI003D137176